MSPVTLTFRSQRNSQAARLDELVDAFVVVINLVALWKNFPRFITFLSIHTLALLGGVAWRHLHLASYLRTREVYAIGLRLWLVGHSNYWEHHALILSAPQRTGGAAMNAMLLFVLVLFVTGTAADVGMSLCRPVRVWLQLLTHAAVLAASLPHTDGLCRTPSFTHPAAERLFGSANALLSWLALLTPFPFSSTVEHRAMGQCKTVLGATMLFLGFWLPLVTEAVAEARAYRHWQQQQAAAAITAMGQRTGGAAPRLMAGAHQPAGRCDRLRAGVQRAQAHIYCTVNAMADGADLTHWSLIALGLGATWDALAALTRG